MGYSYDWANLRNSLKSAKATLRFNLSSGCIGVFPEESDELAGRFF